MELIDLKNKICETFTGTQDELNHVLAIINEDRAIFPFNEYERLVCGLIEAKGLTYDDYLEIRTEYINKNPNLRIFENSSPRGFGEKFAQPYVQEKCSKLLRASKKLDPEFRGEYDLWLDGIKIEVKASRAVDSDSEEPLYIKALSRNTSKRFSMNFQQLKPQCCDVFIWVAVFKDQIVLWIISSCEVKNNSLFSKGQHRGNKGNEGQLHIKDDNIHVFKQYELHGDNLEEAIRVAFTKNTAFNLRKQNDQKTYSKP